MGSLNKYSASERKFLFWCNTSIILLFAVILAGGIVRSSGAGMGCPDWPKCFGQYIPPTDVSQLPPDYQEIYKHRGYENTQFNPLKTWTEYVNRLIGALTGIVMLVTTFFAYQVKENRRLFKLCIVALLLTAYQAWLGGKVVETNLQVVVVTAHMLVALLIVALMISANISVKKASVLSVGNRVKKFRVMKYLSLACLLITVIQIAFGTQVREMIDEIAIQMEGVGRSSWVQLAGVHYELHATFSLVVIAAIVAFRYLVKKDASLFVALKRVMNATVTLLIIQMAAGVTLAYSGLPPVFQTIHLVIATLLFGVQFYTVGLLWRSQQFQTVKE